MLVTWRYQKKDSIIHSFDARAWIIFNFFYFATVLMFWDIRFISGLLALTVVCVWLSKVRLFDSWRSWLDIGGFFLFFTLFTLITGKGGLYSFNNEHVFYAVNLPITFFNWHPVIAFSTEKALFAISMFGRILCLSIMTILLICCIDPNDYGVIFRKMGLPDPIAYGMDLTLRFIPSIGKDFEQTMDAQKARGLEVEDRRIGVGLKIRRMIPLIIPVIVRAISDSDDISNAMDLRAFGSGPRSWLGQLKFRKRDYGLLALGIGMFLFSIALNLAGYGQLWIPFI